jgi:hypothetical protein
MKSFKTIFFMIATDNYCHDTSTKIKHCLRMLMTHDDEFILVRFLTVMYNNNNHN